MLAEALSSTDPGNRGGEGPKLARRSHAPAAGGGRVPHRLALVSSPQLRVESNTV